MRERYCPVSTPRPSGDQGNSPSPNAAAAGTSSTSARRASSEYSTWGSSAAPDPGTACCQVAAWAVCQPTKLVTPT